MSHRPKMIGGVQHLRGCACPTCDPDQLLLARRRAEARAARAAPAPVISPHVAAARYVARAHAPRRRFDPPSPDSKRFIELLRAGHRAAEALQIIAAEKENPPS